mgnify:CR=1 FL=1
MVAMVLERSEREATGDPVWESFDEFVSRRGPALHHAAWLLTHDHHKAEDLVQTALGRTFGRFETLNRPGSSYEAYVRTTMYTTFASWWRRKWNGEVPSTIEDADLSHHGASPEVSTDVARALQTLPRAQRAVIVLRYFEDLTEAETARTLGISIGTVKSHSSRALVALRASRLLLDDDGGSR